MNNKIKSDSIELDLITAKDLCNAMNVVGKRDIIAIASVCNRCAELCQMLTELIHAAEAEACRDRIIQRKRGE